MFSTLLPYPPHTNQNKVIPFILWRSRGTKFCAPTKVNKSTHTLHHRKFFYRDKNSASFFTAIARWLLVFFSSKDISASDLIHPFG